MKTMNDQKIEKKTGKLPEFDGHEPLIAYMSKGDYVLIQCSQEARKIESLANKFYSFDESFIQDCSKMILDTGWAVVRVKKGKVLVLRCSDVPATRTLTHLSDLIYKKKPKQLFKADQPTVIF